MKSFTIEDCNVTLLTEQQAKKLPDWIRACGDLWWLSTPRVLGDIWCRIDDAGFVDSDVYWSYRDTGIRPAFKIKDINLELYERVKVENIYCTAISRNLVLADYIVCFYEMNGCQGVWENSKLKQLVESVDFLSIIQNYKPINRR